MEWHTAFAVPLGTRDFDAVQASSRHDLDALGTETHGVLHSALHGTTEHDALFELLGDAVCDQLGIDFGLAHFFDVDRHRHAQTASEFALECFYVLTFFTNHHAWTC
jgi:hypothetical protein